jgi:hypothetical protein
VFDMVVSWLTAGGVLTVVIVFAKAGSWSLIRAVIVSEMADSRSTHDQSISGIQLVGGRKLRHLSCSETRLPPRLLSYAVRY